MKQKKIFKNLFVVLVQFIPVTYLLMMYTKLPTRLALPFSVPWTADGLASKESLARVLGIMAIANILIYASITGINRTKRKLAPVDRTRTYDNLALMLTLFITGFGIYTLANVTPAQGLSIPFIGLVVAFMGNALYNLRPNYIMGIRLPWTLNSDVNWVRTHHLAGTVWFAAGIAISLAGLLLSSALGNLFFIIALIVSILIPISYSFILHNNYNKDEALSEQGYHQH